MSEGFVILLADENADSRETLRYLLDQLSFEVLLADDGDGVIGTCETDDPDLILMGAELPGDGGLATCRELKALSPMFAKIPVILLVDEIEAEGLLEARAAGVDDLLVRPFEEEGLEQRLLMHLAQSRETRTMMKVSQQRGLSVARSARRRMLGEGDQEHAGLTMATVTQPSEGLGGDVPGFVPLGDHHAGLFVLGVEGRDLGPTLLTSSIHALLTMDPVLGPLQLSMDLNGDFMLPADLLAFLERAFPAERFGWHHRITYVLADGRDGSFRFASRGTPPLLHCATRRGEVRVLGDPAAEGTAMVLGEGMLEPGDLLVAPGSFLATPTGPTGRPFAGEPLESSLRQNLDPDSDDPMDDLNTAVLFALDRHLSGTVPAVDLAIALLGYRTES